MKTKGKEVGRYQIKNSTITERKSLASKYLLTKITHHGAKHNKLRGYLPRAYSLRP
jgi:hypothetical protein